MLNKLLEVLGLRKPEEVEAEIRRKVARELRSSAFLHCDVNKEDVLLAIEHGGTNWIPRRAFHTGGYVKNLDPAPLHGDIGILGRPGEVIVKMEPPVRKDECQADERCGFPLHLPPGAGPTYPPHHAVKISGDSTECLDCGQLWDTNDPEPPATCIPRDPMKFMFDEGFADFPFKKPVHSEVTSAMPEVERIARDLFAAARAYKFHDETQYEVTVDTAWGAANKARGWLARTAFISSEPGALHELERTVARMLPATINSKHGIMDFAMHLIYWCQRNPLN